MKKRIITLTLLLCMLITNTSMAMGIAKLDNHWSKKEIKEDFMNKYFTELCEDNYAKFNPDAPLSASVFTKALESLSNEFGEFKVSISASSKFFTREEMIDYIFDCVKNINFAKKDKKTIEFVDIENMDKIRKEKLAYLVDKGIINGGADKKYNPQKTLTQAEGVLVVQRIHGIFLNNNSEKTSKNLSFEVQNISEGLTNNQETVYYKKEGDQILITFTLKFPNPGYTLGVEKVLLSEDNTITVYPQVVAPGPTTITLQVIAYKTVTISLKTSETGEGPFNVKIYGKEDVNELVSQ